MAPIIDSARMTADDANIIAGAEKVRFFDRPVAGARGSEYTTPEGGRLIDLSATWTAAGLGYSDPRIARAVQATLLNCPGLGVGSVINPQAIELGRRLLSITDSTGYDDGQDNRRVYFGHSGSDANDIALRLCRKASMMRGGGRRVIAFEHSYHGGFGQALGLSGVQVEGGAEPDDCVSFMPYPDPGHPHGDFDEHGELAYCLSAVERELGKGDAACVIVEPILSDGGMIVPPDGFLTGLRGLCDRFGVPLVCDEVKVGLGRPGTLHAYQYEGIHPDVVTFGKTLGCGLPISAIVGPKWIMDCAPGCSLLTMGGNPACCAAALEFLRILTDGDLPAKAAAKGSAAVREIRRMVAEAGPAAADHVMDVRGRGLAMAIELTDAGDDPRGSERFAEKVCHRANELGVVVYYVGGHVLEITPALTIDDAIFREALERVVKAIEDVHDGKVDDDEVKGYGGW
mgnify:CR=1 FL=1